MMRFWMALASVSLAALGGCTTAGGSPEAPRAASAHQAAPRYSAQQFYDSTAYVVPSASGHAFTPDGSKLLIGHDGSGVFNAYLQPVGGGEAEALTQSTTNAIFPVSLFPKDGRLLYTSDGGGNELTHLFVRAEDGAVRDLTPGEKVKAQWIGWSADKARFYVATNERDAEAFDIYAYDSGTYARTEIYRNDSGMILGDLSDDARWVLLEKATTSADSDLYLVDLAASPVAAPRLISAHEGAVSHGGYAFTRDSKALVYATNEHGEFNQAWTYDLASGAKAPLITADWDVSMVQFSPSGRYRVSAINEDAKNALTILDTATGKPVTVSGLPQGSLSAVRFSPDESRVVLGLSSDTSPPDLYLADLASGTTSRLTRALNPAIDEAALVEGKVARFKSWDGLEVPGILYRPKGASADAKVPAIVFVHGGPGGQSMRGYSAMIQHLVNHGYAIYAINNRGSSGYGKTFFHLDDRRHGDVDLKDVVASKDYLAGIDWIAGDRIAVMGGSYGGYITAAALTFHPETFTAGVDIFGVTNWQRTLKSIPAWWGPQRDALYDEMGDPATDEARHHAISPLFHAGRIVRPLMVVQGANDPRVLKVESDELVEAVRKNNVPVEYLVFPDEGHGFLKKANRVSASEAWLSFLDRHVAVIEED